MKLFAVEKKIGENWKTVAMHKENSYQELHSELETLVSLPTCRIKRVLTAEDACRILVEDHPRFFEIKHAGEVDCRILEELTDRLFAGMGKASDTLDEVARLEQNRKEMVYIHGVAVSVHQEKLEFNQRKINAVQEDCDHLIQNKEYVDFYSKITCVNCGKELARV